MALTLISAGRWSRPHKLEEAKVTSKSQDSSSGFSNAILQNMSLSQILLIDQKRAVKEPSIVLLGLHKHLRRVRLWPGLPFCAKAAVRCESLMNNLWKSFCRNDSAQQLSPSRCVCRSYSKLRQPKWEILHKRALGKSLLSIGSLFSLYLWDHLSQHQINTFTACNATSHNWLLLHSGCHIGFSVGLWIWYVC